MNLPSGSKTLRYGVCDSINTSYIWKLGHQPGGNQKQNCLQFQQLEASGIITKVKWSEKQWKVGSWGEVAEGWSGDFYLEKFWLGLSSLGSGWTIYQTAGNSIWLTRKDKNLHFRDTGENKTKRMMWFPGRAKDKGTGLKAKGLSIFQTRIFRNFLTGKSRPTSTSFIKTSV